MDLVSCNSGVNRARNSNQPRAKRSANFQIIRPICNGTLFVEYNSGRNRARNFKLAKHVARG